MKQGQCECSPVPELERSLVASDLQRVARLTSLRQITEAGDKLARDAVRRASADVDGGCPLLLPVEALRVLQAGLSALDDKRAELMRRAYVAAHPEQMGGR